MALYGEGKIPTEMILRAAEQTQALTSLEASHVYALFKSTLDKLALVGLITVDPKVQAQELTQSVGEEITRMIAEQKELEKRFEELIAAQHVLRTLSNKSKLRENQAELQRVAEALRQSTKQLCRNLKDNPNVAENMAKVAAERQALQLLLSVTLSELESKQKIQPILESVIAQEAAEVEMKETIEHERSTTAAVKQLRNDLKDEKSDHEEKMRDKKKTLGSLKDQLKKVKMDTQIETRFMAKELTASNESGKRLEHTTLDDMRKELGLLRQQIEIEKSVHAATADFIRKLSTKLQEEAVNWTRQHEEDLSSKERELELLKSSHATTSVRLKETEERYREELALKQQREMRFKEEREKRDAEAQLQLDKIRALIMIQAAWRGFKVRRDIETAKKGGKGAKKGAKGKKKK